MTYEQWRIQMLERLAEYPAFIPEEKFPLDMQIFLRYERAREEWRHKGMIRYGISRAGHTDAEIDAMIAQARAQEQEYLSRPALDIKGIAKQLQQEFGS